MLEDIRPMTMVRLAVTLLILTIFTLAAFDKWLEWSAPQWFIDQFKDTWMGAFPQTPMYLSIALLETVVAIGALVSLLRLEWLRPPGTIMLWTLVGVLFVFVMLGFGARVSAQFTDAATHFAYFAGTLIMFYVIDRDDREQAATT